MAGTVTSDQGLAGAFPWPVVGPLTDAELRAVAVPVSGTVTATTGGLTDAELRAAAVPTSLATLPNPSNLDVALSTRLKPADTLTGLTTLGTITNVVHVDDNGGSLTVDNANLDVALSTRLKAADTLAAVTTLGTITNVVKTRENPQAPTAVSAKNAAPGIGAVQADTGALAAGTYDFDVYLAISDTVAVGKGLVVEHRNAANAATLFNIGGAAPSGQIQIQIRSYPLLLNERVRVIAGTVAGAANSMYVSAILSRLS